MAQALGVSRCGYYEFLSRRPGKRDTENQALLQEIKKVYKDGRGTYGSPRVHEELKKQGKSCSRKRVAKLMRQEKIQAKMRKKWKVTVAPNHLDQNFIVEAPNKVWISDITYVATREGWLYVAVVIDLFSRKVVCLAMGDRLDTSLIMKALMQALYNRNIGADLMHQTEDVNILAKNLKS